MRRGVIWFAFCAAMVSGCDRSPQLCGALAMAIGPRHGSEATPAPKIEAPREARALSDAFAAAAETIRPSVVRLDVEKQRPPRFGTGAGVIFDAAGHILTASHVIRGASSVMIGLATGGTVTGKVLGTDPVTDVGVVAFERPISGLIMARQASSETLRVGEWTIAAGSPLGMNRTVTAGIVSGVDVPDDAIQLGSGERPHRYIQTDAKLNPGNSGGPLVNLDGEVVGITTVMAVGPGGSYGMAVPMDEALRVANLLIREGLVRYSYIGAVTMDLARLPPDVPDSLREKLPRKGAMVVEVAPHGPAAAAGLREGDLITKIGSRRVEAPDDVRAVVAEQRIGSAVSVEYIRDGARKAVEVRVAELTSEQAAENEQD